MKKQRGALFYQSHTAHRQQRQRESRQSAPNPCTILPVSESCKHTKSPPSRQGASAFKHLLSRAVRWENALVRKCRLFRLQVRGGMSAQTSELGCPVAISPLWILQAANTEETGRRGDERGKSKQDHPKNSHQG